MIRIVCTSCHKPLSLDETKLPMKEVSFPCPVCKTRLSVDRRTLDSAEGAEAEPAAAEGTHEVSAPPHEHHDHDEHDGFGSKALITGGDHPAVRQALKLTGFIPIYHAAAEQAREYYMQEFPQMVVIVPTQLTPPPLESMQPIIALTPVDRRKSFFVLIADGLRTLDGNAAFLYGVNVVVAAKDLGSFPQIYRDAFAYHERLYAPLNSVLKSLHA